MTKKSKKILRSTEFKIFLTAWIVYAFYLQMYGSSCMANSQSALTAAIVNEGRLQIDTYQKVSCDISFYNGHYYSGQPPGISFISAPLYIAAKPAFSLIPDSTIDSLYQKLENYGDKLPPDYWGNKKTISSYFSSLSKRQILEYLFISGFILPLFTTALISALSVAVFYMFIKNFTKKEYLRLLSTALYAFGTIGFHLSTLFFERPIAIAVFFMAFFIIFRIRHGQLNPNLTMLFLTGLLAGSSAAFDYFHALALPLLAVYLALFFTEYKKSKDGGIKKLFSIRISKPNISLILAFAIGMSIPLLMLGWYHYATFDSPFAISYSHRIVETSDAKISDIANAKLPAMSTIYYVLEFFLNSPIMILAILAPYAALRRKDMFFYDFAFIGILIAASFVFALALALVYPTVAPQFNRHMTPIIPYCFLALPYLIPQKKNNKSRRMLRIIVAIGILSIFFNWINTMYEDADNFDLRNKRADFLPYFFSHGPSSPFTSALSGIFRINNLILNLAGLAALVCILLFIWKRHWNLKYFMNTKKQ
ncbi:MAG: hypothetical protein AABX00_04740 [Nanoarchaeota archaeon]